jgi:hypothetical protein
MLTLYALMLEIDMRSEKFLLYFHLHRLRTKLFYQITQPPKPVLEARYRTIKRVENAIRQKYGRQYVVKAFGSTEYGISTAKSDLDLVVVVSLLSPVLICRFILFCCRRILTGWMVSHQVSG